MIIGTPVDLNIIPVKAIIPIGNETEIIKREARPRKSSSEVAILSKEINDDCIIIPCPFSISQDREIVIETSEEVFVKKPSSIRKYTTYFSLPSIYSGEDIYFISI